MITTIIEPLPAKEFLKLHWDKIQDDLSYEEEISLIGHTRYSTSGIAHNQPIADNRVSLVMNGVVTQADPKYWSELFVGEFKTTNDAEILFNGLKDGKNPLSFSKSDSASMALCILHNNGIIIAMRDGKRPLYMTKKVGLTIIASTRDIIKRFSHAHKFNSSWYDV